MQIRSAVFVTSAASSKQFLVRPIPHFVFAGKSNVGKSSLLNRLLNRKSLAKVSQNPGKTRLINYFLVNDNFFFVDIPGYGYARVSKSERKRWGELIEDYLTKTPNIAMIFQLLDIRHDLAEQDRQMIEWLRYFHLPYRILLTKSDKLSKNRTQSQISKMSSQLGVDRSELISTSAVAVDGIKDIWALINPVYEKAKNDYSRGKDAL